MISFPRLTPSLGVACLLALIGPFNSPREAAAQERPDSLRLQIERLAAVVDSLSREVARLQASGQAEEAGDALADLRAAAAAAAAAGGGSEPVAQESQAFVGRQRSLQSLNPEISLNADVFAQVNEADPNADNFFVRDFELSIQSALDPFSRAAVFEFGVEEGYVEWVSLPGGLGVKLGKFFQRLGTLNRWHLHALPFQGRSLPHIAFMGQEPLSQTGVSVTWLAPFGGGAHGTYEATMEVTQGSNEALFGASSQVTLLSHVNGFWSFGTATDLEVGLSWLSGDFENPIESFSRDVYNIEVAFNWIPPARSRQTGLTVRGGYMVLDGLNQPGVAPVGGEPTNTAAGFWSMAELRVSPRMLVGARFDRVENPAQPNVTQWLTSPTITWWQSEFVRLRAEYDFLSGFEGGESNGRFMLQATFAMGPHKHATY